MKSDKTQNRTVLVTGANRGLGLEFARQYAADDWTVIATARHPQSANALNELAAQSGRVDVRQLDIADHQSVAALARELNSQPIDLLLHNAAILGDIPKQTYGHLDSAEFHQVMAVNVYGVLALTEALRNNVIASSQKKIVGITSGAGIVSMRSFAGIPFYCISKSALNRALQSLAAELRDQGVTVGILAPGVADTDMRRALVGEQAARDNRPSVAVASMRNVISRMNQDNTNQVWNFDGTQLPW